MYKNSEKRLFDVYKFGIYQASIFVFWFSAIAGAATINIVNEVQTYTTLSGDIVNMSGVSELHVTDSTTPISDCTINLNLEDSFLFLENIEPSAVNTSTYLSQIRVNGANAVLNTNIRIVQYVNGAVVIPQSSTYQPLQVFADQNFQGTSQYLDQYTYYTSSLLGSMNNNISSFILKRGYTATFAQNENGTGYSKNYVAQDCDLEIAVLPTKLDNTISFVRVFPWRWTSKKGIEAGGSYADWIDCYWSYDYDNADVSILDREYVPMRHNPNWNAYSNINNKQDSTHAMGYNEPDNPGNDGYAIVADAIAAWPNMLASGLRVVSPGPRDSGKWWLYDFIDEADNLDYRVDAVAIHFYQDNWSTSSLIAWLKDIYDTTGRRVWVTEWNDGCNWTGGDPADSWTQAHADRVIAMATAMDNAPFVERYAFYEACTNRELSVGGVLTPAGEAYQAHVAPLSYIQEVSGSGKSTNTIYNFDDDFRDSSLNGNNPLVYGAPKRVAGQSGYGNALNLDGADDYLVLPTNIAEDADFTFAAWIYWDGGGNWQRIFDFGNDTSQYMFLTPNKGSNTMRFDINSGSGSQAIETTALPVGQWTHVAVTLDSNTGTLYINGLPVGTNPSMTNNPSDFQPANNYIGDSQFSADPLFAGMLDDVIIADYALTPSQISDLMTTDQPRQFIQDPLNIVNVSAGSEETGNPAVNSYDRNRETRWANDNTVTNAWIQYDLGSVSEVSRIKLKLNNSTWRTYPIRIEIDGVQVFNGSTSTTSGYWETTFTPTSGRYIKVTMTGNNSDGNAWFSIWEIQIWAPLNELPSFNAATFSEADALELSAYSTTLADDASDPESGPLTFSKDAGSDWLTIAADGTLSGVPQDSDTGSNVFTIRVTDNKGLYDTAQMTIQVDNLYTGLRGTEDVAGLASEWLALDCGFCNGADLDGDNDVTFTDFSMLAHNYLVPVELQLHLKLDEMTGAVANDSSIYWRSGSLVNNPVWSAGYAGGALEFDGSNYVEVAHDPNLNPDTDSWSVAFWMKSDTATQGALIVSKRQSTSPYPGYLIGLSNGSPTTFTAGSKLTYLLGADTGDRKGGYTTDDIVFNEWIHVCVVLDQDADTVYIYINGVSVPIIRTPNDTLPTITTTTPVYIGKNPSVSSKTYTGLLDDVRIYNTALTQQEVQIITSP